MEVTTLVGPEEIDVHLRLLLVEDSDEDEFLLLRELHRGGFLVRHRRVETPEAMREALRDTWDLIISDYHLPGFSGLEALDVYRERQLDTPFLLVSGDLGVEMAVAALKAGAHDFMVKGNYSRLAPAIRRELKEAEGRRARRNAEQSLVHTHRMLETAHVELQDVHEQMLRQQRLKVLGEMAGGVAHDFNNALASILGLAETMLLYPETLQDTAQVSEFLEMICTSAEDGANVVKRLGEFYRDQGAPGPMQRVELNGLAGQTLQLTQAKWKALTRTRGIQVEVVTAFDQPVYALGHPAELRQALTNLIFNAVDAMPQGGVLTLRTRTVNHGNVACLEVSDTGRGMDSATRDRCMEPFFSTKGDAGTGLGLAMVFGILKRHQGMLEIESELGVGSTFRLSFPSAAESEPQPAAPAVLAERARSLRVLLAEEDPMLRRVLANFLQVEGHTVGLVEDGQQALHCLQEGAFDLLVLSRSLAGLTGIQLAEQVALSYPKLPMLLMSGILAGELPRGVTQVLAKPFTLKLFRQALWDTAQKVPV